MSLTPNAVRTMFNMSASGDNPAFSPTVQIIHLKKIDNKAGSGGDERWKVRPRVATHTSTDALLDGARVGASERHRRGRHLTRATLHRTPAAFEAGGSALYGGRKRVVFAHQNLKVRPALPLFIEMPLLLFVTRSAKGSRWSERLVAPVAAAGGLACRANWEGHGCGEDMDGLCLRIPPFPVASPVFLGVYSPPNCDGINEWSQLSFCLRQNEGYQMAVFLSLLSRG